MLRINGKDTEIDGQLSIADILEKNNYNTARVAVEYNGEIIPKGEYKSTFVSDGGVMEIVAFMGGG